MRRKNSTVPERGVESQTITVGGLGTAGGDYKARVRATTHGGVHSPWTEDVEFTLTDADEGTASDPNLPDTVTNLEIRGMLNAIYVEFDDEFFATDNPLMSHNMGSYEIEVSNVSNAFPATGNVWTTTLGDDDDAGPPDGPTRKFNVPTGAGFICTGMKSTGSGGLEHFVRVRGINSRGSTSSAYSDVESVTLDTDDVSQTAVVIGQNAIYATHVKAGTLTATEIQAGTITATEISSGQVFASQIQLPAANPGTDGEADEFHATRAFTIDQDGNMWWGDYDTIALAIAGAQKSYITAAGNATFIGEISTDTPGNARIVIADNTTGEDVDGGPSAGGAAYVLGYTECTNEEIPGHVVFTDESDVAAGYLVAPRFHSGFNYSGVRLRDDHTTKAEAILVSSAGGWAGVVKGADVGSVTHTEPSFVVNAAGGIYLYDDNAPSPYTNRLYSVSGVLQWNGNPVGGGSGVLDIPGLDEFTGAAVLGVADLVAVYDITGGEETHKQTTVADIIALVPDDGIQTLTLNAGVAGTGLSGPDAVIYVDMNELGTVAATTSDKVVITDTSVYNNTTRCSVQSIIDLAPQGDVTAVEAADNGGLYSYHSDGPVPALSLSLLLNLEEITPVVGDWMAIHDNSLGVAKRITIQDILDLGAGDVTGITTDSTSGLYTVSSGGPVPDIILDLSRLDTTTVAVADYIAVFDATAGGTKRCTVQDIVDLAASHTHSYLPLTGGILTGNLNLGTGSWQNLYGNNIIINATGNSYLRGGSGANYGVTAWSTGSTSIYNGTTENFIALGGYNETVTLKPTGTSGTKNLGMFANWWNYSYHYKMDTSALPSWSGSGWYMWFNTDDQVMKASSSERIKKDIVTIPTSDALDRIKALRPVEFTPKTNPSALAIDDMWEFKRYRGFIAEEAAAVDKDYGLYNWWKSDDPESEDYDKTLPSLSSLQDEWTDEEVAAYYDLDKAKPQMFDLHAILADSVAAIQALEARLAVLEG